MKYVMVCLVGLALLLGGVTAALAVSVTVMNDNGNDVFDFSEDNSLDVDIDWNNNLPVWLQVALGSNDTSPIAFSGRHFNITGVVWSDFHIELTGGPTWAEVNAIDPPPVDAMVTDLAVWLFFAPPIPDAGELLLGALFGINPGVDWFINLNGLTPGQQFEIHLQPSPVPEPSTLALCSIGCIGLALSYRQRRKGTRVS